MNPVARKLQEIASRMEGLGIKVVDISSYRMMLYFGNREQFVIAGYLPGKACLMTATGTLDRKTGNVEHAKFEVNAKLTDETEVAKLRDAIGRAVDGGEGWDYVGHLSLNNYGSLEECFQFFRDVIAKTRDILDIRFTRNQILPYVPWHSIAVDDIKRRIGDRSILKISEPFTKRVIAKLPKGLLVPDQIS